MSGDVSAPRQVGDLTPAPYNPRRISGVQLASLRKAMERFGDLSGIVFNRRTGHLIGGHQRVKHLPIDAQITITERLDEPNEVRTTARGLVRLGDEQWTYREVDADEQWEKEANIAANQHGGTFDDLALEGLLLELQAVEADLPRLGFTRTQLARLLLKPEDFKPESIEDQGRLDRRERVRCPECGAEFVP